MPIHHTARDSARTLWAPLRGDPSLVDSLEISGPERVLASSFAVTSFACGAVGVATLAAAELRALRSGGSPPGAEVSAHEACAAFRSEALFSPRDWVLPPTWDPIAGDYAARDRFVRLHTNYASHRAAALSVLGVAADRAAVEQAVLEWDAAELERTVVAAGGCAAAMYTRGEWRAHEHGAVSLDEPAVALDDHGEVRCGTDSLASASHDALPLDGVRVLDLTRVIAGPVCTRFLAAHGADVLRIDPPGFSEVPALVPDVTAGKRCASLDLRTREGMRAFEQLLRSAHVLVIGLRPGALDALGFDLARLRVHNPALVVARLDAYGSAGPWSERRGFDSLVQMSCGLASPSSGGKPTPLPAQALDHGAGYLLAAGVCRALTRRVRDGQSATVRCSLLGVANHLCSLGRFERGVTVPIAWPDEVFETARTAWGEARRVRCPGRVLGQARPAWRREAGPLGALGAATGAWPA